MWVVVGDATLPMDNTCAIGIFTGRADTIRSCTTGLCGAGYPLAARRGESTDVVTVLGLDGPTGAVNEVEPPDVPDFKVRASGVAESCTRSRELADACIR